MKDENDISALNIECINGNQMADVHLVSATDERHYKTREAKLEATIELLRQPNFDALHATLTRLLREMYQSTEKPTAYLVDIRPRMIKKSQRKKLIKDKCADEKITLPVFPVKGLRIYGEEDIERFSERLGNLIHDTSKQGTLPPCKLKVIFYRLKDLTRFFEAGAFDRWE